MPSRTSHHMFHLLSYYCLHSPFSSSCSRVIFLYDSPCRSTFNNRCPTIFTFHFYFRPSSWLPFFGPVRLLDGYRMSKSGLRRADIHINMTRAPARYLSSESQLSSDLVRPLFPCLVPPRLLPSSLPTLSSPLSAESRSCSGVYQSYNEKAKSVRRMTPFL
ncbi:hypothetical protein BC827DRAFT_263351 [Russula dissimulans]|nr:hypothetical protein BC827DRAFT_263351 [Russula dissimulans]